MEQQLSQREKLLKADTKAQGRPKSTIYTIGANLIGAGANKVKRWETMINRPKTIDEGNKSEVTLVLLPSYLRVVTPDPITFLSLDTFHNEELP